MKKIMLAAAISSIAFTSHADDFKDFYSKINAGIAAGMKVNGYKTNETLVVGLEAGANLNEYVSLGVDIDYYAKFKVKTKNSVYNLNNVTYTSTSDIKIASLSAMLNLNLKAGNFRGIKPYALLAAGGAYNKTAQSNFVDSNNNSYSMTSATKSNLAYKFGLGATFSVSDNMEADFHYQYVNLGKVKVPSSSSNNYVSSNSKLKANAVLFGINYNF